MVDETDFNFKHFLLKSPQTEDELLNKAKQISGFSLKELAEILEIKIPLSLKQDKGWIGKLIEKALGAYETSHANVDFPHLNIELKTIPIDPISYEPLETTWICNCPLTELTGVTWETSYCCHKLQKVLFIPIGRNKEFFEESIIGFPILWKMSPEENFVLKMDFEELLDLIVLGKVNSISAKHGTFLQLRGKSSKTLVDAYDEKGNIIKRQPLAFYLKTNFTKNIINQYLQHL